MAATDIDQNVRSLARGDPVSEHGSGTSTPDAPRGPLRSAPGRVTGAPADAALGRPPASNTARYCTERHRVFQAFDPQQLRELHQNVVQARDAVRTRSTASMQTNRITARNLSLLNQRQRHLDTVEVTGSIPVSPTSLTPGQRPNRAAGVFLARYCWPSRTIRSRAAGRNLARDPPSAIAPDAGRSPPARPVPPWRSRGRPGPRPAADSAPRSPATARRSPEPCG